MNQAERAWERIMRKVVPVEQGGLHMFFGTDEYYRASKDCRDGRYSGPSEVLVRLGQRAEERQLGNVLKQPKEA